MSVLNPFLRAVESQALIDHEARLRATPFAELLEEREAAQPRRRHRDYRGPAPTSLKIRHGAKTPMSVRLTIIRLRREGVELGALAQRFDCSERTIHRHLARAPGETP